MIVDDWWEGEWEKVDLELVGRVGEEMWGKSWKDVVL